MKVGEAYIECPHCGYHHENWSEYVEDLGEMEGEFWMQCEKCSKGFNVEYEFEINFTTLK